MADKDINARLFTDKLIAQRAYWTNRMQQPPEHVRLLRDEYDMPVFTEGQGRMHIGVLFPDHLSDRVHKLSSHKELTAYIIFLAALGVLVEKHQHTQDITIISPVYLPTSTDDIINEYVYIRDVFDRTAPFKAWLQKYSQATLQAYEHQDYPATELNKFAALSFNLERTFRPTNIACSVTGLHGRLPEEIAERCLHFQFTQEAGKWKGTIECNAAEYHPAYVQHISDRYLFYLETLLNDPDAPVTQVPVIPPQEARLLTEQLNNTSRPYDESRTWLHHFAEQVNTNPDRTAIECAGINVSYRTLDHRSNLLARLLNKQHVVAGITIAILMDRSIEMAVSIIAVWKAGGAYIPLDVNHPFQRMAEIFQDSGTTVCIIRNSGIRQKLETVFGGAIIDLQDIDTQDIDTHDLNTTDSAPGTTNNGEVPPMIPPNPDDLAYIIYTSGSTGRPKGVQIEHRGMLNHLLAKVEALEVDPDSIIIQNAPHMFDISVWQFFSALMRGGRVVIITDPEIQDVRRFIDKVTGCKADILEVVPSYLVLMIEHIIDHGTNFPDLQYLLVTGETIKMPLLRQWFRLFPAITVINAYGPTEAADDITHCIMQEPPAGIRVPVGKTIRNMHIYIADEHMQLVPFGGQGEILVSGPGIGRGYMNDEATTARFFTVDPFRPGNVRLYKTGDRGRYLPDGSIDFLGRQDEQVKIRGNRIELDEISDRIARIPGIKDAITLVKQQHDDSVLAAYVLLNGSHPMDADDIKDMLSQTLPGYMIPTYIIILDSFPVTTNGKVDRKALAGITLTATAGDNFTYLSETEAVLADIFKEVLEVQQVGREDNFFDLGGHSVAAMQGVGRIKKHLHMELTLPEFFKYPNIKELAHYISRGIHSPDRVGISPDLSDADLITAHRPPDPESTFQLLSLDKDPALKDVFNNVNTQCCPAFLRSLEPVKNGWPRIGHHFQSYQLALMAPDKQQLSCIGNAAPIYWGGDVTSLPGSSLGEIITASLTGADQHRQANTLVIFSISINALYKKDHAEDHIIEAFRMIKDLYGFEHLLMAWRPAGKIYYQDTPLEDFVQLRNDRGERQDIFLQRREASGGKIIRLDNGTTPVTGTIAQWEDWANQSFEKSGRYIIKDVLMEVNIDLENNTGTYYDPAIWIDLSRPAHEDNPSHEALPTPRPVTITPIPAEQYPDEYEKVTLRTWFAV